MREILKLLNQEGAMRFVDCQHSGLNLLHHASADNSLLTIELMREELSFYKELINYQQQDGVTPLYLASQTGHIDVVKLLSSHGADPTIKKLNGLTPIHMASARGDARMLDVLLRLNKHYTVDITD
jgi:ankyrin repeat protein